MKFKDIFKQSTEEKVTDIFNVLENDPQVKNIRQKEEEKINKIRIESINEQIKLDNLICSERKVVKEEIEAATINIKKLRQELQNEEQKLSLLYGNSNKKIVDFETMKFSFRKKLMSTYPPLIDLFILKMSDRLREILNSANISVKQYKSDRNQLIDDRIPETVHTNYPAIQKAAEFIRASILDAESMKSHDLSGIDVQTKLEFYWENVPSIDEQISFLKPLMDISVIKEMNRNDVNKTWLQKNFPYRNS